MALTQLNSEEFTEIVVAADGLLQARSGYAEIASSDAPAEQDWIHVPNGGSMPVAAGTLYGRGSGFVVVQ